MANLEVLNSVVHRDLKLGARRGGFPHFVQIVVGEFSAAAAICPVFLTKNAATGQFYAGAMFGFVPGENLVLDSAERRNVFRPLDLEREGFHVVGENIAIDSDSSRFSDPDGEALFAEDGEPAEVLRHMQRVVGQLKQGIDETDAFVQALVDARLVEPIEISLRFDDGENVSLEGLYTVSLDALNALDDGAVLSLFRNGHLQLAYTMAASLRQIPVLAWRRNQRIAQAVEA